MPNQQERIINYTIAFISRGQNVNELSPWYPDTCIIQMKSQSGVITTLSSGDWSWDVTPSKTQGLQTGPHYNGTRDISISNQSLLSHRIYSLSYLSSILKSRACGIANYCALSGKSLDMGCIHHLAYAGYIPTIYREYNRTITHIFEYETELRFY